MPVHRVLGPTLPRQTSVRKTLGNQCSDGNQNQANPSNSLDIKWYQYRCSNHAQMAEKLGPNLAPSRDLFSLAWITGSLLLPMPNKRFPLRPSSLPLPHK